MPKIKKNSPVKPINRLNRHRRTYIKAVINREVKAYSYIEAGYNRPIFLKAMTCNGRSMSCVISSIDLDKDFSLALKEAIEDGKI